MKILLYAVNLTVCSLCPIARIAFIPISSYSLRDLQFQSLRNCLCPDLPSYFRMSTLREESNIFPLLCSRSHSLPLHPRFFLFFILSLFIFCLSSLSWLPRSLFHRSFTLNLPSFPSLRELKAQMTRVCRWSVARAWRCGRMKCNSSSASWSCATKHPVCLCLK